MTVDRCKAFFDGLEVQVSWNMTRSHGTAPDTGQLVWQQGGTLPTNPVGDLVLKNGSTTIVTFKNCILLRPAEKIGQAKSIVYSIQDRRWKWKTPRVFGQYNVRDDSGALVTETGNAQTARQLAMMLLTALGETTYDVSALPDDINLAPHVHWHYEPAASALDKLVALYACSVVLLNDDSVKIVTLNTGSEPDDTGLMRTVEAGLITNPAPDYVIAYAGDTWFESWLRLEAVGIDVDGQIKPIEMLSYRPDGGWKNGDPKIGYAAHITAKLRGTVPQETIDKTIDLCSRSVFRMFRIIGFISGINAPMDRGSEDLQPAFWPGFTLPAWADPEFVTSLSSLPSVGDPSKLYIHEPNSSELASMGGDLSPFRRVIVWTGTEYRGVAARQNASYGLVRTTMICDPEKIANININPFNAWAVNFLPEALSVSEDDRIASGNPKILVLTREITAVDYNLLLPLLGTRIEGALDGTGKKERRPAEICGIFYEDDSKLRNKERLKLGIWKRGFSVDSQRGIVTLSAPAFVREQERIHPTLNLRIGYGYRWSKYGMRYHRRFRKATGSTLGIADGVVSRTDLNEYRIVDYGSDYNDLSVIDGVVNNTATIDSILDTAATENIKQYQNYAAPKQKPYTPLRAIDLNGKVMQVTYQGGHGQLGITTASIGDGFNITQTPAKAKQLAEQQKRQAEKALQEFRAEQAVIGIIQPQPPGGINTFDASGIA